MDSFDVLKNNIASYFSVNKKNISLVKDTRDSAKKGLTAQYQIGLKLDNESFKKVKGKLNRLITTNNKCTKKGGKITCKVINKWKTFGMKDGNYGALYPEKFVGDKVYVVNHAVQEQLMLEPEIMTKEIVLGFLNSIGDKKKEKKEKKNSSKTSVKSKTANNRKN